MDSLDCLEKIKNSFGCDMAYYKLNLEYETIKQDLLEFKRLDLLLKLPSEQSTCHFTYKDKNLVCMQLIEYTKLMKNLKY